MKGDQTGTCNFESRLSVRTYYGKAGAELAIKEGRAIVGKPVYDKEKFELRIGRDDRRYILVEK